MHDTRRPLWLAAGLVGLLGAASLLALLVQTAAADVAYEQRAASRDGAGSFSFPVAVRVPRGQVLAVDIQPEMLAVLEARRDELGVTNVGPVQGTATEPNLPAGSVDLAFIVDAYHEFSHPREMAAALHRALVPGGTLVLVEYRGEDPAVPIKPLHRMTEAQARRELAAAGFTWVRTDDYLPQQHVLMFEKARAEDAPATP